MDFGVFSTAFLGIVFGALLFIRNKNLLLELMYSARLIIDAPYRDASIRLLESEQYYRSVQTQYNLLPNPQHYDALMRASRGVHLTLQAKASAHFRHFVLQSVLLAIIPVILFAMVSTAHYFVIATILSASIALLFSFSFNSQPGTLQYKRIRILIDQLYTDAGYRNVAKPVSVAPRQIEALQTVQPASTIGQNLAYPLPADTFPVPARASYSNQTPSENKIHLTSYSNEPADNILDTIIIPAAPKVRKKIDWKTISFKSSWWAADSLICFISILWYWNAEIHDGRLIDMLVMPIAIIAILQVFFIPMYITIQVTRKLLEFHPS